MNRHEYFQQKIAGLNPEMADALAYRMNLQEMCDAAMFPGAYRRTLRLAVDAFPEWFLEDLYVSEVTDETGGSKPRMSCRFVIGQCPSRKKRCGTRRTLRPLGMLLPKPPLKGPFRGCGRMMGDAAMTPTERKRIQRARDKAAGWTEVNIRVGQEYAEALRDFAASLPPPASPTDPRQLDMLAELDRQLSGGREPSSPDSSQGSLGL